MIPNNAHGWIDVSIAMIKLCGKSIAFPLKLLFQSSLKKGIFWDNYEKSNIVSVDKEENKNLIKSRWLISLLPNISKIYENLIFSSSLNYFVKNDLFTKSQSVSLPDDSCISQLLWITHEIYTSLDWKTSLDIRRTF